ncbi:MAG: type II secretion system protein GspM [Kofleriaceae bacterium]
MAFSDRTRDFWDRISPRERKLVVFLAFVVPLGLVIWLGLSIRDGLITMEDHNQKTRDALDIIADLKLRGPQTPTADDVKIPDDALALETYVSKAAEKFSLKFKGPIDSRPKTTRNGFVTTTISCALDDITTDQLKSFLQEVEQGNKVVAVTHVDVRRDFKDKKKVDATFDISTYSTLPKVTPSGSGAGSAEKKGG